MIPSPWEFALLALAAYRLTRLGGWDDFPPIAAVREWILREEWVGTPLFSMEEEIERSVSLPGKTPESLAENVRPAYGRPLLAHLVHCPFCLGWWVSLAVYLAWVALPTAALAIAAPFAISGVVGLVAKNLDA